MDEHCSDLEIVFRPAANRDRPARTVSIWQAGKMIKVAISVALKATAARKKICDYFYLNIMLLK